MPPNGCEPTTAPIVLRLPDVGEVCDGTQDAFVIRIQTDVGITGIVEASSAATPAGVGTRPGGAAQPGYVRSRLCRDSLRRAAAPVGGADASEPTPSVAGSRRASAWTIAWATLAQNGCITLGW